MELAPSIPEPLDPTCQPVLDGSDELVFGYTDMALLHHYTISTSMVMSRCRSLQKFYQVTIVQLGLANPFLMRTILSMAALHLAQTRTEASEKQAYFSAAARHHDRALSMYQEALQHIGPNSWSAVLMSSTMLFIFVYTYAMGDPSDVKMSEDDAVGVFLSFRWVRVARGIRLLRRQGQQHLPSGPLWPVLGPTISKWPVCLDPITKRNIYDDDPPCPDEDSLQRLEEMWQDDEDVGSDRAALYSETLKSLIRAYRRTHARRISSRGRHNDDGNEEFMQSMGWLAELSEEYITLLESHDPIALVLMSHYGKIIDSVSFSFWWTHRNSQLCKARIQRILPIQWHRWLTLG